MGQTVMIQFRLSIVLVYKVECFLVKFGNAMWPDIYVRVYIDSNML